MDRPARTVCSRCLCCSQHTCDDPARCMSLHAGGRNARIDCNLRRCGTFQRGGTALHGKARLTTQRRRCGCSRDVGVWGILWGTFCAHPPEKLRKPAIPEFSCLTMVPRRGLEPPRPYGHQHLKLARLPIPPPGPVSWRRLIGPGRGRVNGVSRLSPRATAARNAEDRPEAGPMSKLVTIYGGSGFVGPLHRPPHGGARLARPRRVPASQRGALRTHLRRGRPGRAGLLQHPRRRQRPRA